MAQQVPHSLLPTVQLDSVTL